MTDGQMLNMGGGKKVRYRHQCPECKKAGRRRVRECHLNRPRQEGPMLHWVHCPTHGAKVALETEW